MKGICGVFRELFQRPTHYVAYEDIDNIGPSDFDDWEADDRAKGITGCPDKIYAFHEDIPLPGSIASVTRFNYETNFEAFFVNTMIFYFENDDREKYSVVFGQVKDMDPVRTSHPNPIPLETSPRANVSKRGFCGKWSPVLN
jgi:hypothetical protein